MSEQTQLPKGSLDFEEVNMDEEDRRFIDDLGLNNLRNLIDTDSLSDYMQRENTPWLD